VHSSDDNRSLLAARELGDHDRQSARDVLQKGPVLFGALDAEDDGNFFDAGEAEPGIAAHAFLSEPSEDVKLKPQ
jgi:hypothetical protein